MVYVREKTVNKNGKCKINCHSLKQTIWLQITLNFPMDIESPGFVLRTFQFLSQRSTTEPTRRQLTWGAFSIRHSNNKPSKLV